MRLIYLLVVGGELFPLTIGLFAIYSIVHAAILFFGKRKRDLWTKYEKTISIVGIVFLVLLSIGFIMDM